MRAKIIFIALLFLLFALLAAQNTISTKLNFFLWPIEAPLIVMIVVVFILGLVIGLVSSGLYERKMKKKSEIGNQPTKSSLDKVGKSEIDSKKSEDV